MRPSDGPSVPRERPPASVCAAGLRWDRSRPARGKVPIRIVGGGRQSFNPVRFRSHASGHLRLLRRAAFRQHDAPTGHHRHGARTGLGEAGGALDQIADAYACYEQMLEPGGQRFEYGFGGNGVAEFEAFKAAGDESIKKWIACMNTEISAFLASFRAFVDGVYARAVSELGYSGWGIKKSNPESRPPGSCGRSTPMLVSCSWCDIRSPARPRSSAATGSITPMIPGHSSSTQNVERAPPANSGSRPSGSSSSTRISRRPPQLKRSSGPTWDTTSRAGDSGISTMPTGKAYTTRP